MLLLTSLLAVTVPYSCSALVPSFPSRTKSAAARLSYVTFLPHSGRGTPICRVSDGFFPLFSTPEENDGAAALGESRDMLKKELDVEPPPKSFFQLQQQAYRATKLAMEDGVKLMEVEFPPLPAQTLEADDVSAYDVASANVRLAIDFAMPFTENGKSVVILLPDEAERNINIERLNDGYEKGADCSPFPGLTISSLRVSDPDDNRLFKPEQIFLNLTGKSSGQVKVRPGTDIYIILVASAQELADVEDLHQLAPEASIVFFNLKLDVLRGDLGAPAFPPKEFQDRFLSRVKPVYYLRTRQYSRSISQPPFLLNYQGCLFRVYPGAFQTLLDTGDGRYRLVASNEIRQGLGEFKEELTKSLRASGIIEEEGKTLNFLRTGYKTSTWWEEERPDASMEWRT
uniref:DUF1995 domain-containing protein n=1 Tax=Corethron hystrix TaxID=216773 RepID=A0A7S1FNF7_9STRA|mmetsp:Transcript_14957/g.33324  ORF Transcript_14957/g.33324 Transcript_14957/m.33324 type:complete len:400 (+) Transcript_14957:152-1351(+)